MIRCSDLIAILATALVALPAHGDPLVSDAFGLYDPATSAGERRDWAGWTEGAISAVIAPQTPDHLVIYAGPKSTVAGKDPSHVVAIILDRFGNLVADGTAALVSVDGAPTATRTAGGIADLLLGPQTRAADHFVGVTAADRQSPPAVIGIVADIASIRPGLGAVPSEVVSDTAFDLWSAPLADRYGNPVPQGTGVSVLLGHGDGSYSLGQGVALRDRALIRFIARDIAGPATAVMTLGAQGSERAALSIRTPVSAGLPALKLAPLPDIGALRIALGPFRTTDGYTLADGAQVTVSAALSDGTRVTESAWVQDGGIDLILPIDAAATVTGLSLLSVLGPMDLTRHWAAARAALPASGVAGP